VKPYLSNLAFARTERENCRKWADGFMGKTPHGRRPFSRLNSGVVNVKKIMPDGKRPVAPFQCRTIPPQRILVVEDEPDIRQLNTEVLIDFGYPVDAAEDGLAAWRALNSGGYDLSITDHDMPNVSGLELLTSMPRAWCCRSSWYREH
jgi:hypothetical protein